MDRFEWSDGNIRDNIGEQILISQHGVRIYDGDEKSNFDNGQLLLTNHRIVWKEIHDQYGQASRAISISLSYIVYIEEAPSGFAKSAKIILHLLPPTADKGIGPIKYSRYSHIKFSFSLAVETEFYRCLQEALARKDWQRKQKDVGTAAAASSGSSGPSSAQRPPVSAGVKASGIVGIERKLAQKHQATDKQLQEAFEDLNKLMHKAKEMVDLSKSVAAKIREKQGDITEDETVRFKSYLLSLGIDDPVTRESHGSGDTYHMQLAKQLAEFLLPNMKERGGMMTLTDVYCMVNRARGMELLSPDDLINACKYMAPLSLPVRMRTFDSGVIVLQLSSESESCVVEGTRELVTRHESRTGEELAQTLHISVLLARERLLLAEKAGYLCRDDSLEGLRFYPNLFLHPPPATATGK